jgi:mannonate dehydratase
MLMQECFRWYGPGDPVSLSDIRQAGAVGVVTSLHQIPYGEVWSVEAIMERKSMVEEAGLVWSVVESLPVHEDIKTRTGRYEEYIENYKISLRNLGACGIKVITYNFMPVLDWIRTDLHYRLPDGSEALFFNRKLFVAFDCFILARPGAEEEWGAEAVAEARAYFDTLDESRRRQLESDIVDNFPGFKGMTLDHVRAMLAKYEHIGREELEEHLRLFLNAVCPVAEEAGCRMVIHPDDPPYPILGLPRIFSTAEDVERLLAMCDSPANGIDFCSGSFSGRPDNDLVAMFKACAPRVNFVHLRSTEHDGAGNFYEANHLGGIVPMYELVKAIEEEQIRRIEEGREDWQIPMRPDHGHVMMDDLKKPACPNPGYSALGRMKGLAELRGLEYGIMHALFPEYLKYCHKQ